jgi:lysophospholipase L1-like esterase
MPVRLLLPCAAVLLLLTRPAGADAPGPFVLKDGDRVVLLGSALVERQQFHGYLETRLTRDFPNASVVFRNLGWGGDTVRAVARTGGFENPEGFARLLKEVRAQRPTVIFVGYGANESFAGPAGLPAFLRGMDHLLDQLAPLKARVVILSPTFHEDLGRPFPDPAAHNRSLGQYTAALAKLAARRKLRFVDLFHPLADYKKFRPRDQLTTNGLLPNARGYWLIAAWVDEQLAGETGTWEIEVEWTGKVRSARGAKVARVHAGADSLRFDILPERLPAPWPGQMVEGRIDLPMLVVRGLAPGKYALKVGGREVERRDAAEWKDGVVPDDPSWSQAEKLRAAIVKKNKLFYRRWRPFNDHERHWTYIGGDFKLYDAEVAREEAVIARLRRPAILHCEILRVKGAK